MAARVTIRPFELRKTKSKKLWKNGMRKAPIRIPIITMSKLARRRFRGFDIQYIKIRSMAKVTKTAAVDKS